MQPLTDTLRLLSGLYFVWLVRRLRRRLELLEAQPVGDDAGDRGAHGFRREPLPLSRSRVAASYQGRTCRLPVRMTAAPWRAPHLDRELAGFRHRQ